MTNIELSNKVRAYHAAAVAAAECKAKMDALKPAILAGLEENSDTLPHTDKGVSIGGYTVKVQTVQSNRIDTAAAKALLLENGLEVPMVTSTSTRLTVK